MGRKNRKARKREQHIPIEQAVSVKIDRTGEPTPEQLLQSDFHRDEIIHIETFTRATVHRVRQQSSLRKLADDGQISEENYFSAQQIARVAESIERAASVRCASLEARVDNHGSGRDVLIERIGAVRMERAYSEWRLRLAVPRRMVIDMVLADRGLFQTARVHRVSWPKAKRMLRDALDLWSDMLARANHEVSQDDLDRAHERACA